MSEHQYDLVEVRPEHTSHFKFSGDERKLLGVPLSHNDCYSRKSHLLGPISQKMTQDLSS